MTSALAMFMLPMLAGYLARRFNRFGEDAADVLNRFVVDVCVPAMILRVIPQLKFRSEFSLLVFVPWLLAGLAYAVAHYAGRYIKLNAQTQAALFICAGLGNTSFLGLPLCSALLGERSVPLAAMYDQLGSFLILSTVGVWAVARASGTQPPSPQEMALRVVEFPPFVALLIALLPIPHPAWLRDVFTSVGAALIPVAMFALGLRTRVTPPADTKLFGLALGLKLVVLPAVALIIAKLAGAPRLLRSVLVLESGMPAMISAGALLMSARIAPQLVSSIVSWGVVLSLITVPAWAHLLDR